jgi:HAD superfamily hydrolase (TIGR01549 family)
VKLTPIRVVFFDFGFTLWDEERAWVAWAQWLGVGTLDFFTVLGSVIERGEHHHRAFETLRPGIDIARERERRKEKGQSDAFLPEELYPDVVPCLKELRNAGYRIGVAGNHFADFARTLAEMNLPLDFISSSEEWGVEKPSPEFFGRIVQISGVRAEEIAYVGDRLDNDVRRGPWGLIHARHPQASEADIQVSSLAELARALENRTSCAAVDKSL